MIHTEPSHEDATEEVLEDGDGLGYYDDGMKRTLTDEQIAIFRHSEIQALLRERRLREEEEESRASKRVNRNSSRTERMVASKPAKQRSGNNMRVPKTQPIADEVMLEYNDDGLQDNSSRPKQDAVAAGLERKAIVYDAFHGQDDGSDKSQSYTKPKEPAASIWPVLHGDESTR